MERLQRRGFDDGLPKPWELSGNYGPIDQKIKNLVRAVNLYGEGIITTKASCEGHLASDRLAFPWIGMWPGYHAGDEEKLAHLKTIDTNDIKDTPRREFIIQRRGALGKLIALKEVIDEFNRTSEVKWKMNGMYLEPENQASNQEELKGLQESADELAKYILGLS